MSFSFTAVSVHPPDTIMASEKPGNAAAKAASSGPENAEGNTTPWTPKVREKFET